MTNKAPIILIAHGAWASGEELLSESSGIVGKYREKAMNVIANIWNRMWNLDNSPNIEWMNQLKEHFERQIPDAVVKHVNWHGSALLWKFPEAIGTMKQLLADIPEADRDRPIILFCKSLSWELMLRAIRQLELGLNISQIIFVATPFASDTVIPEGMETIHIQSPDDAFRRIGEMFLFWNIFHKKPKLSNNTELATIDVPKVSHGEFNKDRAIENRGWIDSLYSLYSHTILNHLANLWTAPHQQETVDSNAILMHSQV